LRRKYGATIALAISLGAGCNAGGGDGDEGTLYTLDVSSYEPDQTPLRISNETLVLPLALGETTQSLSRDAPGDLILAYTRVGCWIDDPGGHVRGWPPREVPAVRLTQIGIVQEADPITGSLASGACFAYRTAEDGAWHGLLPIFPTSASTQTSTASASLDVTGVDAAAIFLPLYSYVSKITYRASEE
jgi:hypothetical protein